MPEKTFYDEIVECLRLTRRSTPAVSVSEEVIKEFMTDMPRPVPAGPEIPPPACTPPPPAAPVASAPAGKAPAVSSPRGFTAAEIAGMNWDELSAAVAGCHGCKLCTTRKNTVFGSGSREARLLFFGEGPGADEDAQGLPFVGRAGELLTKMINAMQFSREEVYICNTIKCRPPNNRNPEPDETDACRAYAERQIELVKPEVIVILGSVALRFLFPNLYGGIRSLRGKWQEYRGIKVMPTYHPAYLLRNPASKAETWKDLQAVMAHFGKTPMRSR